MNYEEFKSYVKAGMEAVTGEEVEICPVVKNNSLVLDGLCVRTREEGTAVPTIYLQGYFEAYKNGVPAAGIVKEMLEFYEDKKRRLRLDPRYLRDFSKIRDRILFRVINREKNEELLKRIPHKSFLDLEIVYYVLFSGMDAGTATMLVENCHLKIWETEAEQIHQAAARNTPRVLAGTVRGMDEVMEEMLLSDIREAVRARIAERGIGVDGADGGRLELLCRDMADAVRRQQRRVPMYVLSNKSGLYGAACMLDEALLARCARQLHGNFYILPSSIHEILIMPVNGVYTAGELSGMVKSINADQVSPEEILADHVYIYHQKLGKITM